MPSPRRPKVTLKEVTSDNPRVKRQTKKNVSNMKKSGYVGNPRDRSESLYNKGVMRSFGTLRSGASSNTSGGTTKRKPKGTRLGGRKTNSSTRRKTY